MAFLIIVVFLSFRIRSLVVVNIHLIIKNKVKNKKNTYRRLETRRSRALVYPLPQLLMMLLLLLPPPSRRIEVTWDVSFGGHWTRSDRLRLVGLEVCGGGRSVHVV